MLLAALSLATISCDEDEATLTQGELDEIARQEIIEAAAETFDLITDSKWAPEKFEPSAEMASAAQTEDGLLALTTITRANAVLEFDMIVSFTEENDMYKASVEDPATAEELNEKLLAYQFAMMPDFGDLGFLIFPVEEYMAEIRGAVINAFAFDDAKSEDITNVETGLPTLVIEENNLEMMSFEELLLNSKELVKGNSDKIYLSEDGKLVVEVTDATYGVSKWIYTSVK